MLESLISERSLFKKLRSLFSKKQGDKKVFLPIIVDQLHLIQDLQNKSRKTDMAIIRNISVLDEEIKVVEKLCILNSTQERILTEAMNKEIGTIREILSNYAMLLSRQKTDIEHQGSIQMNELISEEKSLLDSINTLIIQENGIQKSLRDNVKKVRKFEHYDWFQSLVKKNATLFMDKSYQIEIEGLENIPMDGPVIFAPRHFHGNIDPSLMFKIIPRKVYPIAATDWMSDARKFSPEFFISANIVFKKLGAIPWHREDSTQNSHRKSDNSSITLTKRALEYLYMNQALLIFPEAWPIIDAHGTPRKNESWDNISDIRPGIESFARIYEAKAKQKVPIIPIGTKFEKVENKFKNIYVRIGKPMFWSQEFNHQLREALKELSR